MGPAARGLAKGRASDIYMKLDWLGFLPSVTGRVRREGEELEAASDIDQEGRTPGGTPGLSSATSSVGQAESEASVELQGRRAVVRWLATGWLDCQRAVLYRDACMWGEICPCAHTHHWGRSAELEKS